MNPGKKTETLKFKKTTGEMKEAMISVAFILNKHGVGTLYFGVKPNGDIMLYFAKSQIKIKNCHALPASDAQFPSGLGFETRPSDAGFSPRSGPIELLTTGRRFLQVMCL